MHLKNITFICEKSKSEKYNIFVLCFLNLKNIILYIFTYFNVIVYFIAYIVTKYLYYLQNPYKIKYMYYVFKKFTVNQDLERNQTFF